MSTIIPVATVTALGDLAAYQEGAIVSRQVMKAESGNITFFAFDAGQELSAHTTPFNALVHVLDGAARIQIGEHTYEVSAGQGIVMPANVPHAVRAEQRFKMLLTMLRA